jgi:hypothetical protein
MALPVPDPDVPPERMSAGALARYRGELERRLRVCRDDVRREALRAALADMLAEDAERRRIDWAREAGRLPA